jgi:hypothetical protein
MIKLICTKLHDQAKLKLHKRQKKYKQSIKIFEFSNKVPKEKVLPILAFDAFCQMDIL